MGTSTFASVPASLARWWMHDVPALAFGLGTGMLWGLAAAASSVPRGYVVQAGDEQIAYLYSETGPVRVPAAVFLDDYYRTVVEVVPTYFVFLGLAGWVTWQWLRHRRARGGLVGLLQGTDRYLLAVLLGGTLGGLLFGLAGIATLFQSAYPTLGDIVIGALFIVVPAYAGLSLFLLWVQRKRLRRSQTSRLTVEPPTPHE